MLFNKRATCIDTKSRREIEREEGGYCFSFIEWSIIYSQGRENERNLSVHYAWIATHAMGKKR